MTFNGHTLQSVNSPLLKLFEGDLRSGRYFVDVQTVRIVLLLVCCGSELSFLGINHSSAFRIDPISVLSNHGKGYCGQELECVDITKLINANACHAPDHVILSGVHHVIRPSGPGARGAWGWLERDFPRANGVEDQGMCRNMCRDM